jgi:hypothetical protein
MNFDQMVALLRQIDAGAVSQLDAAKRLGVSHYHLRRLLRARRALGERAAFEELNAIYRPKVPPVYSVITLALPRKTEFATRLYEVVVAFHATNPMASMGELFERAIVGAADWRPHTASTANAIDVHVVAERLGVKPADSQAATQPPPNTRRRGNLAVRVRRTVVEILAAEASDCGRSKNALLISKITALADELGVKS